MRSTIEDLTARLHEANARADFIENTRAVRVPEIYRREKTSGIHEAVAVGLLSDIHAEERVIPEKVGGLNEYNLDIADARLRRFADGYCYLVEKERSDHVAVRDLILWIGGDTMTGHIHPDNVESTDLAPVETILWLRPRLNNIIATIKARLQPARLDVVCSFGNHGRDTPKPRVATGAEHSYEWLMYNHMRDDWKADSVVRFTVDRAAHQWVNVHGEFLHFHHGDDLKYQGGIGGLEVPLKRRIATGWDRVRRAAVHNVGHWHSYIPGRRFTVNGSVIGVSPYSIRIGADPEAPMQAFYTFSGARGKESESPIWCSDAHAQTEAA